MKCQRKTILLMVSTILSAAAILSSCSSHGGSKDGGGAIYTGGGSPGASGGSGGSSSSGGETTTAMYTSCDSAGGYLNVEGGQYRTCMLVGNSTGGTITLSDGIRDDLTGTYGTLDSSSGLSAVVLSAASSGELRIEGCWTVTFNGGSTGYSYSILATRELFSIRCVRSDGTKFLFNAGIAVNSDSVAAVSGGSSASENNDDIFNGTCWDGGFEFRDGGLYVRGDDGELYYRGPYVVVRTADGYKLCRSIREAMSEGRFNSWAIAYTSMVVSDAGASEAQEYSEVHGFSVLTSDSWGEEYRGDSSEYNYVKNIGTRHKRS